MPANKAVQFKIAILVLLFMSCLQSIAAQNTIKRNITYKAWLTLSAPPYKAKGLLYQIQDSSIALINSQNFKDYTSGNFQMEGILYYNVEIIRLRKYNKIGNTTLIGAASGLVLGVMIGLISGDDPPGIVSFSAERKALSAGAALAVVGAGVGAIIGSIKIKIPINGSKDKYEQNRKRLKKYALRR